MPVGFSARTRTWSSKYSWRVSAKSIASLYSHGPVFEPFGSGALSPAIDAPRFYSRPSAMAWEIHGVRCWRRRPGRHSRTLSGGGRDRPAHPGACREPDAVKHEPADPHEAYGDRQE